MTRPAAERRVDRFILAARTLGDQAARIFAIDALIDYAAEQTRAAIAERDLAWAKAVLPVAVCVECNEAFGFAPFVRPECRYCAPLRTLLAAGEERTE